MAEYVYSKAEDERIVRAAVAYVGVTALWESRKPISDESMNLLAKQLCDAEQELNAAVDKKWYVAAGQKAVKRNGSQNNTDRQRGR